MVLFGSHKAENWLYLIGDDLTPNETPLNGY